MCKKDHHNSSYTVLTVLKTSRKCKRIKRIIFFLNTLLHRDVAKETRCRICSDTATLESMSYFLKG